MKLFTSFLTLVITFSQVLAFAGNHTKSLSNTEIKTVKIYLNGALITRQAKVQVETGITQITFEGLPQDINRQSIQVTGTGDATIFNVNHEVNFLKDRKKSPEQLKLEAFADSLTLKLDQVLNTKSGLTEEESMILSNKHIAGQNTGVTSENIKNVAELFRNRIPEIRNKVARLNRDEKKIREELDKVNNQLNFYTGRMNQPTSQISVTVSAKAATTLNLELAYLVYNAGWSPAYDIRTKDINSPIQLSYKANIYQNTGENWNDIKIILSTTNPSVNNIKPVLFPWELDFYVPRPAPVRTMGKMNRAVAPEAPSMMKSEEAMELQGMDQQVVMNEKQLNTEYEIPIPYSVPSDGKIYAADIKSYDLNASYSYSAIPKLDRDAFLMGRVTGWEKLDLLPGPSGIYFEGTYVGETFINAETTNDTLEISLGRDKRVNIKREKLKDLVSEQFFGSNKVKNLAFEISVRNTKKEPLTITLEDLIPVARNKDIEVKLLEADGGKLEETTGRITWKITIKPGETIKKRLSFSVKYPKDKILDL